MGGSPGWRPVPRNEQVAQETVHGRGLRGYLALGGALLVCPCHLSILAVLLAGTGLGAYIAANQSMLFPVLGVAFLGLLVLGLRALGNAEQASAPASTGAEEAERSSCCAVPAPPEAARSGGPRRTSASGV